MRARPLDELVGARLLERRRVGRSHVRKLVARAERDLGLARDVLAPIDEERAMTLAYEAGFRACLGLLALAGYRVRSQPGHHRGALEGAAAVLGPERLPLLTRLDHARDFRNASLYEGARPLGTGELAQLLRDVSDLIGQVQRRLR